MKPKFVDKLTVSYLINCLGKDNIQEQRKAILEWLGGYDQAVKYFLLVHIAIAMSNLKKNLS